MWPVNVTDTAKKISYNSKNVKLFLGACRVEEKVVRTYVDRKRGPSSPLYSYSVQ